MIITELFTNNTMNYCAALALIVALSTTSALFSYLAWSGVVDLRSDFTFTSETVTE